MFSRTNPLIKKVFVGLFQKTTSCPHCPLPLAPLLQLLILPLPVESDLITKPFDDPSSYLDYKTIRRYNQCTIRLFDDSITIGALYFIRLIDDSTILPLYHSTIWRFDYTKTVYHSTIQQIDDSTIQRYCMCTNVLFDYSTISTILSLYHCTLVSLDYSTIRRFDDTTITKIRQFDDTAIVPMYYSTSRLFDNSTIRQYYHYAIVSVDYSTIR